MKVEISSLVLSKNSKVNNSTLLKEKRKIDEFVLEFQNEVMESHKALWTELHSIRKSISHERAAPCNFYSLFFIKIL